MQRHRFFAPPSSLFNSRIVLDAEESHHLARVLRLLPGATVYAFDGNGAEYECEVTRVHKDAAELQVIARLSNEIESPLLLTLGQALIKGDKFDWVVQKATELGVTRLVPLMTAHSEFRKAESRDARLQRWRRIALEATKQCGRRKLMEVAEVQEFSEFCSSHSNVVRLIFSERGGQELKEIPCTESVLVTIGPEGGWSEQELAFAAANGFLPIQLGNRILRTETAAVAAVTLAQHLFGDFA